VFYSEKKNQLGEEANSRQAGQKILQMLRNPRPFL
jgi:hypothetical protein